MLKPSVFIVLIFSTFCCAWSQPEELLDYSQMVTQLETELNNGKKLALRDLGSLLDKEEVNQKIRTILSKRTFFTLQEIDVVQSTKSEFLSFYYDNEQKIQYSELLNAFYITPLENRKISFEMRSTSGENRIENIGLARRYHMDIDENIRLGDFKATQNLVEELGKISEANKEKLLINLIQDQRLLEFPTPFQKNIYENLLLQLSDYPEIKTVEVTLQLLETGHISEDFATRSLLKITNCSRPPLSSIGNTVAFYQSLVDSLETLEDIRQFGYNQLFSFNINFFQHPVDYYGKILTESNNYPWIRENALLDLIRSNHPRALFYIAADFYKTRNKFDTQNKHLQLIKSKTNVDIGIKNRKGEITYQPEIDDDTAMLNYLIYWAVSYEDYEWDHHRQLFTSKMESFAKTQNYERLFRRFNSKNDSIALLAFLQLTEGDPVEVITLAQKYRQLLRNHNSSLPSMKFKYLEQLTLLTAFCRKNEVNYKPNKKLQSQLSKLYHPISEKERYHAENQLINSISIEEITTLEFYGFVYGKNEKLSLSIGRILDWFYSNHWKAIIQDNNNLRLYLKKSYLFENIGVEGVCNHYLNKFDLDDKYQKNKLLELKNVESDRDILNQMLRLLEHEPEGEITILSLDDFLEAPLLFNHRELKILPPPTLSELETIVAHIQESLDPQIIKQLFNYLRLHPKETYVPKLFKLIDDQRVINQRGDLKITVADNVVLITQQIYSFKAPLDSTEQLFATNYWRVLWKRDSLNFQNWGIHFYEKKLDSLASKTTLDIAALNELTASPFYNENYTPDILKALKKVRPIKNIRKLDIHPKLSVSKDLQYFDDFVFSYKVLDDIPKLFAINNENALLMFDFLQNKSASFSFSEKGSFYNNLFRSPWLNDFIKKTTLSNKKRDYIKTALLAYLEESEFLSAYEEQTTFLNIAKLAIMNKSLEAKLEVVFQMNIEKASKVKILEEIIAGISFTEISYLLGYFDELSDILGDKTCAFFHRDFGLPIFQIRSEKERKQLLKHLQNFSEFECYKYYLSEFGVDFLAKNGTLDFEKIYKILQFDIVSPLASEGASKRDNYIFGIVRLLEIHFNTRLGFHEKLNENQTFYSFSSLKRAEAWANYLEKNHLITKKQVASISFNHIKKGIEVNLDNSVNKGQ